MLAGIPVSAVVRANPCTGVEYPFCAVNDGCGENSPFLVDVMKVDRLCAIDWLAQVLFPNKFARISIPGIQSIRHGSLINDVVRSRSDGELRYIEWLRLNSRIVRAQC